MSINKSIFYELCNKDIMVNLYKLLFLSFHFSFQLNKRVFHAPTFPSFQPNTHEEKLNIFHPPIFSSPTNFPSSDQMDPSKKLGSLHFVTQIKPSDCPPKHSLRLYLILPHSCRIHIVDSPRKNSPFYWFLLFFFFFFNDHL